MADEKSKSGEVGLEPYSPVTSVGPDDPGADVTVSASDMPPAEPGHSHAKAKEGEVFDPNAARRAQEGKGPGLQDSEAWQPATWVQDVDPREWFDREIDRHKAEIKRLEQEKKDLGK